MAAAHVQTGTSHWHSGETALTTGALTFTSGNCALVVVHLYILGVTPTLSACSVGGTAATLIHDSGDKVGGTTHMRILFYIVPNIAAGSKTAAATVANSDVSTIQLMELTQVPTSSPQDGVGLSASGTSTAPSSGSYSASQANNLWIGSYCAPIDLGATQGSGWTIPTNGQEIDGTQWLNAAVEHQPNPAATSRTATFTIASGFWVCSIVSFLDAAGAGGSGIVPIAMAQYRQRRNYKKSPGGLYLPDREIELARAA